MEGTPCFEEKVLSQIKGKYWKAMCDYAHTGGLHVRQWIMDDSIQPNYPREAELEVMKSAETIASLSVMGFARLSSASWRGFASAGIRQLLSDTLRMQAQFSVPGSLPVGREGRFCHRKPF